MKRILFLFLSLTFVAGTSFADIVVSEDFTTDTGSLISTGGPGDAALTTVTGGQVVFNDSGDGGRAFIGTAGSDFASQDFTATIDFINPATGGVNGFFGLGPGAQDAPGAVEPDVGNSFGEPSLGPVTFIAFNADDRNGGEVVFADFENEFNGTAPNTGPIVGSGSHTLQIDFDFAAQTVTYSAFVNGAATITELAVVDVSDNAFDATNARIFFGGEDGAAFDNFSVHVPVAVPEPGTAAFLGLSVLGSMFIRRRRA